MKTKIFIGIDWGGTFIKSGIFNERGKLICRHSVSSESLTDPKEFFGFLKNFIKQGLKEHGLNPRLLKRIGVGAPGIIEMNSGLIYYLPNIKGWENFPFKKVFERKVGVPLSLDNDANIASLAELKKGKAKGLERAILITLGTGIGSGLILDGKVFQGKTSAAEAGHMPLTAQGRSCGCGARGCIQTFLGNKPFTGKVKSMLRQKGYSSKSLKDLTPLGIYQLALKRNKVALEAWKYYGNILGVFLSGLVNLLNPQVIILGGGLSKAARFFMPQTRKTIKNRAMRPLNTQVKITTSSLGSDLGIVGAFELARKDYARR